MPNPLGVNGYGTNPDVSDEDLKAFLTSVAYENGGRGLTIVEQIAALHKRFGINIGKTKLCAERKRLGIPSVRRNNHSHQEQVQALVEISEQDLGGSWGVGQVRGRLAQEGVIATRETIRNFNNDHFPADVARRMAMSQKAIPRKPLNLKGPFHQIHWDGHEKLSTQALNIDDGIGLCFYGGRCAWTSQIVWLVLLPNVRDQATIGHAFLDWIIDEGYVIPFTNITDKGTEVAEMMEIQNRLRVLARPDFDPEEHPPTRQVKSTHNTPIEGLWRWQRQSGGHDIKAEILDGRHHYNVNLPFHKHLFYWVWVPLIQEQLDKFKIYYNAHSIRKQKKKNAPTGVSPNMLNFMPETYDSDARDCRISVEVAWVNEERERLGGLARRDELYAWYPSEFGSIALSVWEMVGQPTRQLNTAWAIFSSMSTVMEAPGFWDRNM